jgi:hypothetical protein
MDQYLFVHQILYIVFFPNMRKSKINIANLRNSYKPISSDKHDTDVLVFHNSTQKPPEILSTKQQQRNLQHYLILFMILHVELLR